jgi:hypothetical protein
LIPSSQHYLSAAASHRISLIPSDVRSISAACDSAVREWLEGCDASLVAPMDPSSMATALAAAVAAHVAAASSHGGVSATPTLSPLPPRGC